MNAESRKHQTLWVFGSIFLTLSLVLLGFNSYLRFFSLAQVREEIDQEKKAIQKLQEEQEGYLKNELRDLFSKYSDGVSAVASVLAARDAVFSGELDDDTADPVMLLDYPDFLEKLQKLLGRKTVVSNLNIDRSGQVSFLVQTNSYLSAAQQITALRLGLAPERQRRALAQEEVSEEMPELLIDVEVSSVGKNDITGAGEDVPVVLRDESATFNFVVQMRINPEYYFYLQEQRELAEEEENS
jgi:hypothetical protein